jgi:hypothetical protein
MNNTTRFTAFIALVLLVSSCGIVKTQYADWTYKGRGNDERTPEFKDDAYLYELADRFGLMALFAHVSYRDDLLKKDREFTKTGELKYEKIVEANYESACDYLQPDTPLPTHGMPYFLSSDASFSTGRWSRWRGSNKIESEPCYNHEGLFYETYVYISANKIQEAVIAFRGTENNGAQFWHDWRSNLASFFGFEPEQYKIASKNIPKVIRALKETSPDIRIYATGHSLGGGLAQQAGYLSRDIKEVFTFNTSPVTNWTRLALDGNVENAYPIIHRIYNGGEVLGGIRSVSTLFTKARYGRHDIGIQVKPKQLIAGHSMTLLSCHLACLIEDSDESARHHFSPNYIRSELMVEGGVCTGYVDFGKCNLIASSE